VAKAASGKIAATNGMRACEYQPSVANPKFAKPWSSLASEFRIQSHTGNLLILVWFSNLNFLNADAMVIPGTSNSPHENDIGCYA
jgi:hypothetical protein